MKKIQLFSLVILSIAIACQKKSVPVISTRTSQPSIAKANTTAIQPDTVTGKSLFAVRCSRCHGLPEIALYTGKRWEIILNSMIPKAKLTEEQALHLKAYIRVNCRD